MSWFFQPLLPGAAQLLADTSVSGTVAVTLLLPTISITATETISGTVSTTLVLATASASGTETFSGTVSTSLSLVTISATANETFSGSISTTLALVTVSGNVTAVVPVTGTVVTLVGETAPTQYQTDSAVFDGTNDYLARGAGFTGAADSNTLLISFWIKSNTIETFDRILSSSSENIAILFDSGGHVEFFISTGASQLYVTGSTNLNDGNWHHVMFALDNNSGSRAYHFYVDGIPESVTVNNDDGAFTIDFTQTDWYFATAAPGINTIQAQFIDFYFAPGQYLDISNAGNRAKFRTQNGKPVDLGATGSTPTGTAPILFLHLDQGETANNFATNAGTGNGMTLTGSLTTGETLTGVYGALDLAISANATETFTGAISTTLLLPVVSVSAVETFSGTVATTLLLPTTSITASETFSGTVATTLNLLTLSLSASENIIGYVSGETQQLTTKTNKGFIISPLTFLGDSFDSNGQLGSNDEWTGARINTGTNDVSGQLKWYFEAVIEAKDTEFTPDVFNQRKIGVGVYSETFTYDFNALPGGSALESAVIADNVFSANDASVYANNTILDLGVDINVGDVIMVAVWKAASFTAIFFGKNGTWLGSYDPENLSGGTSIGLQRNWKPGVAVLGAGKITLRTASDKFSYAPPTNFKAWATYPMALPQPAFNVTATVATPAIALIATVPTGGAEPLTMTRNQTGLITFIGRNGRVLTRNAQTTTLSYPTAMSELSHGAGKYYWEVRINTVTDIFNTGFGFGNINFDPLSGQYIGQGFTGSAGIYCDGSVYSDTQYIDQEATEPGVGFADGDVAMFAVDLVNKQVWIGKNGTWFNGIGGSAGDPAAGTFPFWTMEFQQDFFILAELYAENESMTIRGQANEFSYSIPTGFTEFDNGYATNLSVSIDTTVQQNVTATLSTTLEAVATSINASENFLGSIAIDQAMAVDSVTFDGTNDYLSRAGLNGVSDTDRFILSFWFKVGSVSGVRYILHNGVDSTIWVRWFSNDLRMDFYDNTFSDGLSCGADIPPSQNAWHHVLVGFQSGTGHAEIYIDDVKQTDYVITDFGIDPNMDFGTTSWGVGANPNGFSKYQGDLAELYLAPGQYLDFDVAANRRKFSTLAGSPKYLGLDGSLPTGTAPAIYLHLDPSETITNFAVNRGSGGDFSITGALTNASTDPGVTEGLSQLSISASATETMSGSVAATLSLVTMSLTATETMSGAISTILLMPVFNAQAVETLSGSISTTLALVTASATATESILATVAATLVLVTVNSASTVINPITATMATTLSLISVSGLSVVTNPITATVAATLSLVTVSGTGAETFSGSVNAALKLVTVSISTVETFSGSITSTLTNMISVSATAIETFSGSISATLFNVETSATVTETMIAAVNSTLTQITLNSSVTEEIPGTVDIVLNGVTVNVIAASIQFVTTDAILEIPQVAVSLEGYVSPVADISISLEQVTVNIDVTVTSGAAVSVAYYLPNIAAVAFVDNLARLQGHKVLTGLIDVESKIGGDYRKIVTLRP